MKIELPSIAEQRRFIFEEATKEAIAQLEANLLAPVLPAAKKVDDSVFPDTHLLSESEGWEAPPPQLIRLYFEHFKSTFAQYDTDAKLAQLLGLNGGGNDRRIRAFKDGSKAIPYNVWRTFLVMTGRVPQDIIKVMMFM